MAVRGSYDARYPPVVCVDYERLSLCLFWRHERKVFCDVVTMIQPGPGKSNTQCPGGLTSKAEGLAGGCREESTCFLGWFVVRFV